jgi:hypothetical protein
MQITRLMRQMPVLRPRGGPIFTVLRKELLYVMPHFDKRQLAHILHAYAVVGLEDRELFDEVGKAVLPYMADLDPEEIATFGFSYAKSGIPNPELFLQMSKFARDRADEFNPRQIGMVCWAYATLGTQTQEDFDMVVAVAQKVLTQLEAATATDLEYLVTAVTEGGFADNVFLRCLGPRLITLAVQFDNTELISIIVKYARKGTPCPPLYYRFCDEVAARMSALQFEQIADVAWAVRAVRFWDGAGPRFAAKAEQWAEVKQGHGRALDINLYVKFMLGMAHLGTPDRWTNADSAALRVASVKFYHEQMPWFKQAETRGQFTAAHLVDTVRQGRDLWRRLAYIVCRSKIICSRLAAFSRSCI